MLGFGEAKHDTPRGKHNLWGHEPFVHFNEQRAFKKVCKGPYVMDVDLFHNGGQIKYSFVLMLIGPSCLA